MNEKEEMKVKEFVATFFELSADDLLNNACYPKGKRADYYNTQLYSLPSPCFISSTNDYAGLVVAGGYSSWLCPMCNIISEYYSKQYTLTERLALTTALVEIVLKRNLSDVEKELVNLATQLYSTLTRQLSRHYNDSINCSLSNVRLTFSMFTALENDHLIENAKLALYLITDADALSLLTQHMQDAYDYLTDDNCCTFDEVKYFKKLLFLLQKCQ